MTIIATIEVMLDENFKNVNPKEVELNSNYFNLSSISERIVLQYVGKLQNLALQFDKL